MTTQYSSALKNIILQNDSLPGMDDPAWSQIAAHLTESDCSEAARSTAEVWTNKFGCQLRPCKSFSRVQKKLERKDSQGQFKAQSDLSAVRIPVPSIADILRKIREVVEWVHEQTGYCLLRNPIEDPATKKPTDIVAYLFVYLPTIGYITEVQIGHPFALMTFAMDSFLRDNKDKYTTEFLESKGIYDFWDSKFENFLGNVHFYDAVKGRLLRGSAKIDTPGLTILFQSFYGPTASWHLPAFEGTNPPSFDTLVQ